MTEFRARMLPHHRRERVKGQTLTSSDKVKIAKSGISRPNDYFRSPWHHTRHFLVLGGQNVFFRVWMDAEHPLSCKYQGISKYPGYKLDLCIVNPYLNIIIIKCG